MSGTPGSDQKSDLINYARRHLYLVDPGANVSITNDPAIVTDVEPHRCTIGGLLDGAVIYGNGRGRLDAKTMLWDVDSGSGKEATMPPIPFILVDPSEPLAYRIISFKGTRHIPGFKISIDDEWIEAGGARQPLLKINGQLPCSSS